MAAGLGSSAAATVAGLRMFERVTRPLPDSVLLGAATALEGHADNAAPALFGGFTSVMERSDADPIALRWTWPEDLRLIVATPSVGLATAKARAALPTSLPRKDAVFNLQRVLALVNALQSRQYDRIRDGVADRWHQPARAALVPLLDEILGIDDPEVLGAFLSGAGPSVAVIARRDFSRIEQLLRSKYERAGCPATIRTLGVHQSETMTGAAAASVHGRSA
jgi:homoserine kinase